MRVETVRGAKVVIGHCGDTTDLDYLREIADISPEARSEPNGSYRDFPQAQSLPASGCSG